MGHGVNADDALGALDLRPSDDTLADWAKTLRGKTKELSRK
jgi:hypothetical protein